MIVVISIFIQIGKNFLDNSQYEKLYKLISAFFIMIIIFLMLFPNISKVYVDKNQYSAGAFDTNETNLKDKFEENLEQIIENDIHNKFYVNYDIRVETDFEALKVFILKTDTTNAKDIAEYVRNTYCTPKDEVIMINEFE